MADSGFSGSVAALTGHTVVTGDKDVVVSVAKIFKTFSAEFKSPR